MHHRIGAFLPSDGQTEKYAQIYIIDQQSANNARNTNNPDLQKYPAVMQTISDKLQQNHAYVEMFKHAYERLRLAESEGVSELWVSLRVDPRTDRRRYNLPVTET